MRNKSGTDAEHVFIKEKEREETLCPTTPSKALFDLWNECIEGSPLSYVRELSSAREKKCSARLKERSLQEWGQIFRRMATTPFLSGQNPRGWKADFDWIMSNDGNAAKVLEGKYDQTGNTNRQSDTRYTEIFAGA